MTKAEKQLFDSMVRCIAFDIRRKLTPLGNGKSGRKYVVVPLTDVLNELRIFTTAIKSNRGKR